MEPMNVPSGQVQKVFYGVWFGSLLVTAVVGVMIGQVWPRAGGVTEPTNTQNANQNVVADNVAPKTTQPDGPVPIAQREKLFGPVTEKTNTSLTIEKFFLEIGENTNPKYVVQLNYDTVCKKTIIKKDNTFEYTPGSCSDITTGMFVTAIPTLKKISNPFVGAEISYSKENPYALKDTMK